MTGFDKNTKGNRDCLAKAQHDEPMFILLGRDRAAPDVIDAWCSLRLSHIKDGLLANTADELEHINQARQIAQAMRDWQYNHPTASKSYNKVP